VAEIFLNLVLRNIKMKFYICETVVLGVNKIKQYKNAFGIKIKYVSLSEVEGPFMFQENDLSMIRSLAKNIYTGE
jgi:hypothetical protein